MKGLEVGLKAFNLASRAHCEILLAVPTGGFGQNGEIIRRRLTGTISWAF